MGVRVFIGVRRNSTLRVAAGDHLIIVHTPEYALGLLSGLGNITYRAMMGEYILHYRDKALGSKRGSGG